MIIVRVELHSAITGQRSELARMHIANTGGGTAKVGNYQVETLRGRSTAQLDRGTRQRTGYVMGHRRLDEHVWNLVAKSLVATGYAGLNKREELLLVALQGLLAAVPAKQADEENHEVASAYDLAHFVVSSCRRQDAA